MRRIMRVVALSLAVPTAGAAAADLPELAYWFGDSAHVFECRVLSVGECPGVWSGSFPAYQSIECEPQRVFRGRIRERVEILHPIVRGGARILQDEPCIDPTTVIDVGPLVVFVNERDGRLVGTERGLVSVDAAAVGVMEQWSRDCIAKGTKPTKGRRVTWSVTDSGQLDVRADGVTLRSVPSAYFAPFTGGNSTIERVQLSPDGTAMAVELSEPSGHRVMVRGMTSGSCPLFWFKPIIDSELLPREGPIDGFPHHALWLDSQRLAFLVGFLGENVHAVFVESGQGGELVHVNTLHEPESLMCTDGRVIYESKVGRTLTPIPCD